MQHRQLVASAGFVLAFATGACATAQTVADPDRTQSLSVPASASLQLAGMPDGTTLPGPDAAPAESPIEVDRAMVVPGAILQFEANGRAGNTDSFTAETADGDFRWFFAFDNASPNGISNVQAPVGSLVGVFLPEDTSAVPLRTPPALDYREPDERNARTQAPKLGQVFFIGDGKTDFGIPITFRVPLCARRLYLGVMDRYEWKGNPGVIAVHVASDEVERETQSPTCF